MIDYFLHKEKESFLWIILSFIGWLIQPNTFFLESTVSRRYRKLWLPKGFGKTFLGRKPWILKVRDLLNKTKLSTIFRCFRNRLQTWFIITKFTVFLNFILPVVLPIDKRALHTILLRSKRVRKINKRLLFHPHWFVSFILGYKRIVGLCFLGSMQKLFKTKLWLLLGWFFKHSFLFLLKLI